MSIIVRRTIPQRVDVLVTHFTQLIEPMSWIWRVAASNRSLPSRSTSPTRSGHSLSEDVGVRIGHRHHHLRQTGAACDSRHRVFSPVTQSAMILPQPSICQQCKSKPSQPC